MRYLKFFLFLSFLLLQFSGKAAPRHLEIRSNVLGWNGGYGGEILFPASALDLGITYERAIGTQTLSLGHASNNLETLGLFGDLHLNGQALTTGFVLSAGFFRSDGWSEISESGSVGGAYCGITLHSSGVLFDTQFLVGYGWYSPFLLSFFAGAGVDDVLTTPSYHRDIQSINCSTNTPSPQANPLAPAAKLAVGLAL